MDNMKIKLVIVNTARCRGLLSAPERFCSAGRRARARRLRSEGARLQSYAAELALAYALSGAALEAPEYSYAENGRPVIENGYVSLSHSGEWAACAYSHEPVGVDIEAVRSISPRIARRVLSENERAVFDPVSGSGYLLDRFVMKEAYFKLTGEGLGGGFGTVEEHDGRILRNGAPAGFAVRFSSGPFIGYAASYEEAEVEITELSDGMFF